MALAIDMSVAGSGLSQAAADARYEKKEAPQNVSPLTGATVVMTDTGDDALLNLTPAGTLAALTITLPTEANSRVGQIVRIHTSQTITALTINGATTIRNTVATLLGQDDVSFQKTAANTWSRLA